MLPGPSTFQTESNCFGCAPHNPIGLRLRFGRHGDGNVLATRIILGANYESFPGVVHGGIVASIMDEVLAQAVHRCAQVSAFTTGLRVRYGQPMRTGAEHVAYAEVTRKDDSSVRAAGRLELSDGGLVAAAEGTFRLITDVMLGQLNQRLPSEMIDALRASNEPWTESEDKDGSSSKSP